MECVILAAGSSSRLGMDKALIDVGPQKLISWISQRLSGRVANITIVVNEANFMEISELVSYANVVLNPDPHKGRTGSLKVGIDSIDSSGKVDYGLLVGPCGPAGILRFYSGSADLFGRDLLSDEEGKGRSSSGTDFGRCRQGKEKFAKFTIERSNRSE